MADDMEKTQPTTMVRAEPKGDCPQCYGSGVRTLRDEELVSQGIRFGTTKCACGAYEVAVANIRQQNAVVKTALMSIGQMETRIRELEAEIVTLKAQRGAM